MADNQHGWSAGKWVPLDVHQKGGHYKDMVLSTDEAAEHMQLQVSSTPGENRIIQQILQKWNLHLDLEF